MNKKYLIIFSGFFLLFFAFIVEMKVGSFKLTFHDIYGYFFNIKLSHIKSTILTLRMRRTILVMLVGSGLSIAGATYQGALRNMLADPFILGVSSGAALLSSITITYKFSFFKFLGLSSSFQFVRDVPIMAFIGAMLSIVVLMFIYKFKSNSLLTLILGGVAINSFLSATLTLVMYYSKNLRNIYGWLLGSFSVAAVSLNTIIITFIIISISSIYLIYNSKILNIMMLDERVANSLGIDVERNRLIFIIVSSLIVAIVVAVSGMIGFIGLLVPHGARFIIGADNKFLLPFSFIAGGATLALCDALSHTLISGIIVPVGVITSFFGAPFFIYLLLRRDNL